MISLRNVGFELTSGSFSNPGKMDLFAGSEPRKFFSFHLDKEQTGQPLQEEKPASEQNISDLDATDVEGAKDHSPVPAQESTIQDTNQNSLAGLTDELMDIPNIESTADSSTGNRNNSFGTAKENPIVHLRSDEPDANVSTQETSEATKAQHELNSPALKIPLANNESALQESSSSQEGCQTTSLGAWRK